MNLFTRKTFQEILDKEIQSVIDTQIDSLMIFGVTELGNNAPKKKSAYKPLFDNAELVRWMTFVNNVGVFLFIAIPIVTIIFLVCFIK